MNPPETTRSPVYPRFKLGYLPELDGLRGIAILLVLGNHIPLGRFSSLLPGGFAGVDLFFVLSGFLITTLLVQEFDSTGSIGLRNFYIRRALRLGPALIAMLIVLCAISFVLYDKGRALGNCLDATIALFYVSNWVRVFSRNQLDLLAHTWSLSVEEQFYLIWPITLRTLLRKAKERHHIVAVAVIASLLSWLVNIHLARHLASTPRLGLHLCFGSDSRAGALMLGCALSLVLSSGRITGNLKKTTQKALTILAPVSLVCLLGFSVFSYTLGQKFFYYGFIVLALLAATLILDTMISPRSIVRRLLVMKWLVWLGSVSYGVYLWHWPIFYGMHHFGFKGWTVVWAGLPATFLVVLLSYYFMEQPILRLKGRFGPQKFDDP